MVETSGDLAPLIEADRKHHLHPFTTHPQLARKGSRVIARGEGVRLWDAEGNEILDGMAGLWCVQVGYGRERLARAAYDQMVALPYYNTFFQTATEPSIRLACELARLLPEGFERVFFVGSGSEATDSAVKIVRNFWNIAGRPEKKTIVSRKLGYHGSTGVAASLTGMSFMHGMFDLPLAGHVHVDDPYGFAHGRAWDDPAFGLEAASWLERKILEIGAERVGAFVAEPIQGAGGVIIPPATYWPAVQEICKRHDVLLVADEVICGFGRTGAIWGSTRFGIEPDIIAMAKGLSSGYAPIGAVALGARVGDAIAAQSEEFAHGFTYSGHPVCAAVALENLAVMEEEGLFERASGPIGEAFARAIGGLADHPIVGETRSCGLIAAIEIVADKERKTPFPKERGIGIAARDFSIQNGLIARAVRDAIVLSPPLILTESDVEEMADKLRRALDHAHAVARES